MHCKCFGCNSLSVRRSDASRRTREEMFDFNDANAICNTNSAGEDSDSTAIIENSTYRVNASHNV